MLAMWTPPQKNSSKRDSNKLYLRIAGLEETPYMYEGIKYIWTMAKLQSLDLIQSCYLRVRGSLNKFPDFFRMGTFIDSTHLKL